MPSRYGHAVQVTHNSLKLAAVPALASLLSTSQIARTLSAGPGGGVTFPLPTGLPTLWTYVSVPNTMATGGGGGPLALPTFIPLFLLGLLLTSALEAGFLGTLSRRLDGEAVDFVESMRRFVLRMVGVNLVRAAVVVVALPLMVVPPLALLVVLILGYTLYGLPFVVVVRDAPLATAINATVSHALDGGLYAQFGIIHLVAGAAASLFLTAVVRNIGIPGILLGTVIVAVPSVFVSVYGLLVFRDLRRPRL